LPGDERRQKFAAQAKALKQVFQWWDAIDGRAMQQKQIESLTDRPVQWNTIGEHDALSRPGELALILSSIALWQHAYKSKWNFLVVMEDDAILLDSLSIEVPKDADLVFFNDRNGRNSQGLTSGYVCGTDGYLVTKAGINKLLSVFKEIYMPLDLQMIAQMPQMQDCNHHLAQYFRGDLPSLQSYTVAPLVANSRSASRIKK